MSEPEPAATSVGRQESGPRSGTRPRLSLDEPRPDAMSTPAVEPLAIWPDAAELAEPRPATPGDPERLFAVFARSVAELRQVIAELEPAPVSTAAAAPPAASAAAPSEPASPVPAALSAVKQATAKLAAAQQAAVQFAAAQVSAIPGAGAQPGVADLVASITKLAAGPALPAAPASPPAPQPFDTTLLRHRLQAIVRRAGAVTDSSALASQPLELTLPREVAELRQALAALADEWLIQRVHWPGRDAWSQEPLEHSLYGSSAAGRVLFARMSELEERRREPALRQQLAAIYLTCLELGFCGEWRGDVERLASYRAQLRRWLPPAASGQRAFAQAYAHVSCGPREERLAPLRRWWRGMLLASGVYLVLSLAIWVWLSRPLLASLSELLP